MKFLLPIWRKFTPRKRIGEDPRLPKMQREMLDAIDVTEQRGIWNSLCIFVNSHVLLAVVIAVAILYWTIGGPAVQLIRSWVPWLEKTHVEASVHP